MDKPWDDPTPIRVELATNPASQDPQFRDISAAVKGSGVSVRRGRPGRWQRANATTANFVVDNSDGQFSDVAGEPVSLLGKRVRVSSRNWRRAGNLLVNGDFSPALGVTGWSTFGFGSSPTVATSTTRSVRPHGQSMLVTWGTEATAASVYSTPSTFVIGRKYEGTVVVWVPAGSPAVTLQSGLVASSGPSTGTAQWLVLRMRWTATLPNHQVSLNVGATTSGQQLWVGAARVDEGWTSKPLVEGLRTNYATNPRQTTPDKVTVPGWSSGAEYIEPQFHTAFLGSLASSSMTAGPDGGGAADTPLTDVLEGGHG